MQIPSAANTIMAMTSMSPSDSASFLKHLRDQTSELVEEGINSKQINPFEFQKALNQSLGTNAQGLVNSMGEINYEKLDQLLGGNTRTEQATINSSKKSNDFNIFSTLFNNNNKPSLFSLKV